MSVEAENLPPHFIRPPKEMQEILLAPLYIYVSLPLLIFISLQLGEIHLLHLLLLPRSYSMPAPAPTMRSFQSRSTRLFVCLSQIEVHGRLWWRP